MGIVGGRPETGVRLDVSRPREGGPPWRYEGEAATPTACYRVIADVDAAGDASVELPAQAPAALVEKVRLILRAAWRHAREDDVPPPRRIVRWRADGF